MSEDQALTVAEVATRLRANPETIRRWLNAGTLSGYRPGGTKLGWRIPESEVRRIEGRGDREPDGAE